METAPGVGQWLMFLIGALCGQLLRYLLLGARDWWHAYREPRNVMRRPPFYVYKRSIMGQKVLRRVR
jgi:hypothetical protein